MRVQMHAHATSVRLEIKVCFEKLSFASVVQLLKILFWFLQKVQ